MDDPKHGSTKFHCSEFFPVNYLNFILSDINFSQNWVISIKFYQSSHRIGQTDDQRTDVTSSSWISIIDFELNQMAFYSLFRIAWLTLKKIKLIINNFREREHNRTLPRSVKVPILLLWKYQFEWWWQWWLTIKWCVKIWHFVDFGFFGNDLAVVGTMNYFTCCSFCLDTSGYIALTRTLASDMYYLKSSSGSNPTTSQ